MSKRSPQAEREFLIKKAFPKRDYSQVPQDHRSLTRQLDRKVLKVAIDMTKTDRLLIVRILETDAALIEQIVSAAALLVESVGFTVPAIMVDVVSAE